MYSVGIDIGTTKIAFVYVDIQTGKVTAKQIVTTPTLTSCEQGEHAQDACGIIRIVLDMLKDVTNTEVCAIGISGQMHGIVYLDKAGCVISPLYTWQDTRASEQAAELGIPVGYGHATHAYLMRHGLVPSAAVGYVTIADAVCAALCEVTCPAIHASNAASLGCFDIDRNRFTQSLKEPYPYEIERGYRIQGSYHGIPVAVGIGDNQASFLGSGCGVGDMLINIGTGAQVCALSENALSGANVEIRPGFDGYYLAVGAALCGGRAYAMLHDFFCDVVKMATGTRPESLYEAMAVYQNDAADASLRFDNAFCGTRSDPHRRGSICGIGPDNFTPRQFCVGLLEGMINELADMYAAMGLPVKTLVGAGNALRKNPLLQQLCEKRFGAPLRCPEHREEAAVGAALFALICNGTFSNAAQAASLLRTQTFQ